MSKLAFDEQEELFYQVFKGVDPLGWSDTVVQRQMKAIGKLLTDLYKRKQDKCECGGKYE